MVHKLGGYLCLPQRGRGTAERWMRRTGFRSPYGCQFLKILVYQEKLHPKKPACGSPQPSRLRRATFPAGEGKENGFQITIRVSVPQNSFLSRKTTPKRKPHVALLIRHGYAVPPSPPGKAKGCGCLTYKPKCNHSAEVYIGFLRGVATPCRTL